MLRLKSRRLPFIAGGATLAVILVAGLAASSVTAAPSRASVRWNHLKPAATAAARADAARESSLIGAPVWEVLELHEIFSNRFTFVDVGEAGDSPGDYGVFRDRMEDAGTGQTVGTVDVQCIASYADQCRGSIRIAGRGQVTFDGITPLGVDPDHFAVTGGTGEFAGTGGVLKVEFPSNDYALLTVTLTR